MKRKDILIMIISSILLIIIISLSYAYFALNTNLTNNIAQNISFNEDYSVDVEVSNRNATPLAIGNYAMMWSGKDEVAASTSETFIINVTNNSNTTIYCTYDFVWEWQSGTGLSNYTISSSATKEYTFSWAGNEVQVPNYNASSFVLGQNGTGAIASGTTESFSVPTEIRFYNLANVNQSSHYNKAYLGYAKLDHVVCSETQTLANFVVYDAPRSGTDVVSNSPWVLAEDHTGEWRYAGRNPDNYIQFNGELWRIMGVMPNMEYCVGTVDNNECNNTKTGALVKIIRHTSLGKYAWNSTLSNNWLSASLMTTLQSKNYASFDTVATAKWSIYGLDSKYTTNTNGNANVLYNRERNINNMGLVYEANQPYWYGTVGLMYPSDYAYATNGGTTYDRSVCLSTTPYSWGNEDAYNTDCANNSWVRYNTFTSSTSTTAASNWFLTPGGERGDYVTILKGSGQLNRANSTNSSTYYVKPALYLKPDVIITGGNGTWSNPYTIESKQYWFPDLFSHGYTYPEIGGTVQTQGTLTGHNVYIGQDSSKYYDCATIYGNEICLSQPYTQYGLSDHTLNSSLTSDQQNSAKQAIYQAFIAAGINVDIDNNCSSSSIDALCTFGDFEINVNKDGGIEIYDYANSIGCIFEPNANYCISF